MELIAFFLLVFGIPAFLLFLFCRWLWRKNKIAKAFALGIPAFIFYQVYFAIYPPDSFYENEFLHVSGLKFPESGEVLFADATFPDTHGDYSSCVIFTVSNEDVSNLISYLSQTSATKNIISANPCENSLEVIGNIELYLSVSTFKEGGSETLWGITQNKKMVYVMFSSW